MMDVVFGTAKKGEPLPILPDAVGICPTLITPGLVAKPSNAVWHETEPCFLDGVVTTVTKIAIHGRIPLEWAWPNPRAGRLPTARRPRLIYNGQSHHVVQRILQILAEVEGVGPHGKLWNILQRRQDSKRDLERVQQMDQTALLEGAQEH